MYTYKKSGYSPHHIFAVVFAAVVAVAGVFTLFQQHAAAQLTTTGIPPVTPMPQVVEVDGAGNILIRGHVQTVGEDAFTLATWGGIWTIETTAATRIIPNGPQGLSDPSLLSVGDFVGVRGVVAAEQSLTVVANLVRDWTTHPFIETQQTATATNTTSINTANEAEVSPAATTTPERSEAEDVASGPGITFWSGTVTEVNYRSLEIRDDFDSVYTIAIESETQVRDREGNDAKSIFGLDIQEGSYVNVNGSLEADNSTISATEVTVQ